MRLQVIAGLVVGLYAASAHADGEAAEPIGIRYKAPAECPDSFAFFREIASHTSRVRAARRGETALVFTSTLMIAPASESSWLSQSQVRRLALVSAL
jgi:hypothetical protein